MNLTEAYKMVFKDLISDNSPSFFKGRYDAKNGNSDFMYGIECIMEFIAIKAESYDNEFSDFDNLFIDNMIKSEKKAGLK